MTCEERVRTELEGEGAAGVRLKVRRAGLRVGEGSQQHYLQQPGHRSNLDVH